jgi:hypothetical protein
MANPTIQIKALLPQLPDIVQHGSHRALWTGIRQYESRIHPQIRGLVVFPHQAFGVSLHFLEVAVRSFDAEQLVQSLRRRCLDNMSNFIVAILYDGRAQYARL